MSQNTSPQENKMGTEPVGKLLLSMALPLMISMLVQALYNIVDSVYVSRVNEAALTAVSMAFPIQTIMIALTAGTGVGMNAMLSHSLGAKDQENANKAASNGLFLALCNYIVFVLIGIFVTRPFYMSQISYDMEIVNGGVSYMQVCTIFSFGLCFQVTIERILQGTGNAFYSMITQMTGAIINIVLDPVFIFGFGPIPAMGVTGAGVATVIGQITAGILAVILNQRYNKEIQISLRSIFQPSWTVIKRIYKVGIPSIIMQSIGSIMYYGMNLILTDFNSTASAVFGVYYKLQSFFFMPIFGMNNAIVPIMAFNYGAQKRKRMMETLKKALTYSIVIMIAGSIAFETVPALLLSLFAASDNMLSIGIPALRIIGIHFPVAAICIILGTVFQALGKATYSAIVSLIRQLFVLLPVAYLLARFGGLGAVWWCFPIAEISSLIVTLIFYRKIYREVILAVPE